MSPQIGPNVAWPDTEALVRSWLVAHLPQPVNVRTETDATFGTSSPNKSMVLPLVLVQRIPGGSTDPNLSTEAAAVDIECYAATRAEMWALYKSVHAWMLRLGGQRTTFGAVDSVDVMNGVGEVNYANPNLRRCVVTYRLATRAQFIV